MLKVQNNEKVKLQKNKKMTIRKINCKDKKVDRLFILCGLFFDNAKLP